MNNKQLYETFYSEHYDIPIYSAPWWLDAACGKDNWDVILIKDKNEKIIATFPYYLKTEKFGLKNLTMPLLTQKLGPYIVYEKNMTSRQAIIGYEHDVYLRLIENLPKFDIFNINFDQKYKNWLPFYWNGFSQTSKYSYKIYNIKDSAGVLRNFSSSKRQPIKKAKSLTVKYDLDFNDFYTYFEAAIKERNGKVSYSRDFFVNLCNMIYNNKSGRVFYCVDEFENIHAVNLTCWDHNCAYYLVAMRKEAYKTSGGTELLVYETIKYVSQFVDEFDFEGSMIEGVEASYRRYGSCQTEYYNISKMNNPLVICAKDAFSVLSCIKRKIFRK